MVREFPTRRLSIPKIAFESSLPEVRNRAALTLSAFGTAPLSRSHNEFWRSMAAEKARVGRKLASGPAIFVSVLQHNPKEVSKLMKKAMLVLLVVFAAAALAVAQSGVGSINNAADILGPHLGYGRGCVMCHAPHSGPRGNNKATNDTQAGEFALWGQDLTPLYGQVINFSGDGAATYQVTLPAQGTLTSAHDANTVILFCLSCHDGNLAKVGMMKGVTVETLPIVGGNAPTLLGADGTRLDQHVPERSPGGRRSDR